MKFNGVELQDGQVLAYSDSLGVFVPGEPSGGSQLAEFVTSSPYLLDDEDFTVDEPDYIAIEGMSYQLITTSTATSGLLTVELYNDASRTDLVFSMSVDLSDSSTMKTAEPFGFDLETDGTIYGTAFVSGVGEGETFDLTISAVVLTASGAASPMASPYGDGIEDDGGGQPRIALSSVGGLEFNSGNLIVKVNAGADAKVVSDSDGLSVTGVVDDSTSQAVSAKKVFDSVGYIATAETGEPTSGTYSKGAEILDVTGVKYRCTVAGTPGTWELADSVLEIPDDVSTSALSYTDSELVEIPTRGNCGVIQQLTVFAVNSTVADSYVPFRVRIYETSDAHSRELLWQASGVARQTQLSAELPASQTYLEVDSNDYVDVDEAIVVYEDSDRYELARCSGRTSGNIDISESLVDASAWDVDTPVLTASEWTMVPFSNADGSLTRRIFLEIRHDGLATDPDLIFIIRSKVMSTGVVR